MLEKAIEAKLGKALKRHGCLWYKFVSPGCSGVPDRICITPTGDVWFVELKTDTGRLSSLQINCIADLIDHHAHVRVVRGAKDAELFVKELFPDEI